MNNVYLSETDYNIRWKYIKYAPRAAIQVLPFMLLGSGFGTASLGYAKDSYILSKIGYVHNFAYDLENTYLSYLFDTGIVGFILYLSILKVLVTNYRSANINERSDEFPIVIWCLVCSSLFSMAFYHYILFGPQMLMITIALSQIDNKEH